MQFITDQLREHLNFNASQEVYRDIPSTFEKRGERWGVFIDYDKIKNYHLSEPLQNIELINKRILTRGSIDSVLTGDYIKYLDGHFERITYVWDDTAQAGGGSGSFYMGDCGHGSYSGSLNSGLPLNKLELTNETKDALFWFFSRDWAGGGRGIYFLCPVKIWNEIE